MNIANLPSYWRVLDEIQAAWDDVSRSRALRVIVLEGESGANKTNVIETFLKTSQAPAVRCRGVEIPESYLPLRIAFESILKLEIVQEQLYQPPGQVSSEWQMALTALAQVLTLLPLAPTPTVEALARWQPAFPERAMSGGFEADEPVRPVTLPGLFALALGELAGRTPLVFLVDDVDLADDATVEALTLEILPALKDSAVLLIAVMEPKDKPATTLAEFIRWAESAPFSRRLTLSPLSVADIQTVLRDETPELAIEQLPEIATHIHRATGGNLARVHDIARWINQTDSDALAVIATAPDHTAVLQAQFVNLSDLERAVLQMASVRGATFCAQAVALASGKPFDEIEALLDQIVQTGQFIFFGTDATLQEMTLRWYHFQGRHTRDWVYSTIPQEQRPAYHREMGRALEALYGDAVASIAGTLAQQFEQGKMLDKAARYYAEVARQANEQGATNYALDYAQRGLDVLANTQGDTALQCVLLLQKGQTLMNSEKTHLAEDVFRQALEVAREVKPSRLEMESLYYLGELLLNGNIWDEGMELVGQAMELAVEQKAWSLIVNGMEKLRRYYSKRDPQVFLAMCDQMIAAIRQDISSEARLAIAEILEDKAWLYHEKRRHSETLETLQQAAMELRSTGSLSHFPGIHYKLHQLRAQSLRASQNYAESLDEAERALAWAKSTHSRTNIAQAHRTKATTLRHMGRISEGEQEYETALAMLLFTSDLITLAEIENSYGLFLSRSGRKRRAREFYARSYTHRQEINYLYGLQISQNNLAAIDTHLGLFQSALNVYQQLYNEGIAQDDKSRQSLSLNNIGNIYRMLGRLDQAEIAHQQAAQLCDAIDQLERKAGTLGHLGQTFLCSWRLDDARVNLDRAEKLIQANKLAIPNNRLHNHIYMGRLALCESNLDDSSEQLRFAIEGLGELQDQVWVGIGHLNLGLLLLVAGQPVDALSAAQSASEALHTSESWRTAEACHLLARCYLATGDLEQAQREIELAKAGFMDLGLFHRVFQAESTELHIQDAQDTGNWSQWQHLDPDEELRYDFNHLGI